MSVADDLAQRLEAAREKFHAVRDFVGPGDSRFKPEVIRMYEAAVEVLEEAHELALDSTPPPAPAPRAPKESSAERARRIRASRERRLREARDRVDAYERRHPINEHGVRTGPSVAANNYVHRNAAVDRELDSWVTYQKDIQSIRRLTGLIEKETS
ncbi:hypothetical protein OH783_01695 [Kocuria rhizophila]|uniref:hypothetical protein n=1 Tax=Kocuria rhizophila TaxID=72000 RepID=UPI00386BE6D2|nr:hypothetical protein OH783_01695 [Kocuria rhizophila]WSZ54150.1 hypothetical protein OG926_01695 [Kocuria rhizophila]